MAKIYPTVVIHGTGSVVSWLCHLTSAFFTLTGLDLSTSFSLRKKNKISQEYPNSKKAFLRICLIGKNSVYV